MSLDAIQTVELIEVMENYIQAKRPPENMRSQIDIGYGIDGQSIVIHEIRPRWDDPSVFFERPIAKATFVKAKNLWKLFWMRADLKWHTYSPTPTVKNLKKFVAIVDEDKHGCFWG